MQEEKDQVYNPHLKDHEKVSKLLDPWGGRGVGFAKLTGLGWCRRRRTRSQPTPQDHEKVSKLLDPWGGSGAGFA